MNQRKRSVIPYGMQALRGSSSWQDQEERLAAVSGGRRVPGSGSSPYARGDVRSDQFLIEAKQTGKDAIRITWAWLVKITRQAVAAGRMPALAFEIRSDAVKDLIVEHEWVAIPLSVWQRLFTIEDDHDN